MVVLPRLARALNSPLIAALLGAILIAVGIFGLASGDVRAVLAVVIIVVGIINLIRTFGHRDAPKPTD
jgi:hypothetical protein